MEMISYHLIENYFYDISFLVTCENIFKIDQGFSQLRHALTFVKKFKGLSGGLIGQFVDIFCFVSTDLWIHA